VPPRNARRGRRRQAASTGLVSGTDLQDARSRQVLRGRIAGAGPLLAGLLAVLLLLLTLGLLLDGLAAVAVAGILLPLVLGRLGRLLRSAFPWQRDLVADQSQVLLLLQDALVLAAVLRSDRLSDAGEVALVVALLVLQGLRMVWRGLQVLDDRQQAARVEARNLPEPVPSLPPRPAPLVEKGPLVVTWASALVALGLAAALLSDSYVLVPLSAWLAVLLVLAVVLVAGPAVLEHLRLTRGQRHFRFVHQAVQRSAPLVVLYFTGGPADVYWVTAWLDTLEHLEQRALIMIRDPEVLDRLPDTTVPVVCLPERLDVGRFGLPTARVALFVAHSPENVRLLRKPTLRSAFIGHGDSDKVVSASPQSKAYDEVWVAGEVGRQRYADADVGVRADAVRVVGRPQARRVEAAKSLAPGAVPTVLFAPSWEGVGTDPYESSLLHSGLEIVQTLLDRGDVRVIYRPHPKTGERNPAFLARHLEILHLLEAAGAPHVVDRPHSTDLLDRFNESDVLIADRSGVLSDFLASNKPYVVVNALGVPDEEFRVTYLSTAGAYLLRPGGAGLDAVLVDALGPDSMRAARRSTRAAVIGPASTDALAPFAAAVDALARR